jgi:hypothetical protein
MCFDFLYDFYQKHFSFWEQFSEILSQIFKRFRVNSCRILIKIEFSEHVFEKKLKYQIFTKIRPVGDELRHADGRTWRS